ncbi:MAG: hypothetical protein U9R75_03810, partial [Candidatus Thermoplasmatota archaeon]|nr:hypothetical protein [Candidatus Thermoplasmatota archaeon]
MKIYLIGGVIDLVAVLILQISKLKLDQVLRIFGEKTDEKGGNHLLIWTIAVVMGFLWLIFVAFLLHNREEDFLLLFLGEMFFFMFYLKWNILDVPAQALASLGKSKMMKWSTRGSIPMVLHLFCYISILIAFSHEDA